MNLKHAWDVFYAAALAVCAWYIKWKPNIDPIIRDVEQRALDGRIDRDDRKAIVMDLITQAQNTGKFKMSPITAFFMPFLVDYVANQLPDFDISQIVKSMQPTKKEV